MYIILIFLVTATTFQESASLQFESVISPYVNKNSKFQSYGGHEHETTYRSQETYSNEATYSEERREQKLDKMKKLLNLLKDLKDKQFRKRNMRLSDAVAEEDMIQDRPEHGPFYRVLIPHPPRAKRIVLRRSRRKRKKRRRIRRYYSRKRKLGLRLHNNFNFRNIRKAYKAKLFTRIFVCFFNVFC